MYPHVLLTLFKPKVRSDMNVRQVLLSLMLLSAGGVSAQVQIDIDAAQKGKQVSPMLYGIFYEDINHAADEREFDVFISHASEDKDQVVRPLALALQNGGLKVWYDEFELKIGDSLRRKIDKGLAKSRFGVVVLSKSFLGKGWANYELDGIITRSVTGEQVVLPIWHEITKQEVIDYSPSLADKLARNTATHTIDEIAAEIIEVISDAS